jgi:hypothetical protein
MNFETSHLVEASFEDSNFTRFATWDAAFTYAGELTSGPVTVQVHGDPTVYRITADGRKRALCRTESQAI